MKRKARDRTHVLCVRPICPDRDLPCAVFIREAGASPWKQYSHPYWYRKSAENFAKMLDFDNSLWLYVPSYNW